MKKETKIQLIIIVVLVIILGIFATITVKTINEKNTPYKFDKNIEDRKFKVQNKIVNEENTITNDVETENQI